MNSILTSQSSKPKLTRLKKLAIGSCGVIVFSILVVAGLLAFALWGGGGEPATLNIAIRVTREFVQAIHNQQIDTAYSMLSEKFSPQITKEQLATLIQQDEDIFNTYRVSSLINSYHRTLTESHKVVPDNSALSHISRQAWREKGKAS